VQGANHDLKKEELIIKSEERHNQKLLAKYRNKHSLTDKRE
jgi:hypothetical protein